MDPAQNRELLASQAAVMVVVMLSFVVSRLRRSRPELDPLLYHLRSDAEQHTASHLQLYRCRVFVHVKDDQSTFLCFV
jgi:hypothetical protein